MKTLWTTLTAAAVAIVIVDGFSTAAQAQTFVVGGTSPVPIAGRFFAPGFRGDFRGGYRSSTALEGALRGQAAVIDATGRYNKNTAEAASHLEDAKAKNLQNRELGVQTYWNIKRIGESERAARRRPVPSSDKIQRINDWNRSERPRLSQLDPATGEITWPMALQGPTLAAHRAELERLFAARTVENSGPGSMVDGQVKRLTKEMKLALGEVADQLLFPEYQAARNLLDSLAVEAQYPPPQVRRVALTKY